MSFRPIANMPFLTALAAGIGLVSDGRLFHEPRKSDHRRPHRRRKFKGWQRELRRRP